MNPKPLRQGNYSLTGWQVCRRPAHPGLHCSTRLQRPCDPIMLLDSSHLFFGDAYIATFGGACSHDDIDYTGCQQCEHARRSRFAAKPV